MVAYDEDSSLDELARAAETLLSFNKGHLTPAYTTNYVKTEGPVFAAKYRSNNTAHQKYSNDDIPIGVRSFSSTQLPKVCRYHLYYGKNARSCKPWCIMASSRMNMLPNSRPQSRSSSPAPGNSKKNHQKNRQKSEN